MFGLFKKKQAVEHEKMAARPPVSEATDQMQHEVNLGAKDASIFLDENEFRLIYELAFSSNAHSGMFFAACAGYKET